MPHLRLHVPDEWLDDDFRRATGFDARALLDHLVAVVANFRMPNPARAGGGDPSTPDTVPMINLQNLKHAVVPLRHAHVGGDPSRRFLHVTLDAGNDAPGRTPEVRRQIAELLGNEIDMRVSNLTGLAGLADLASVTVHVRDIDRDRGYSTTAERRKKRGS